MTWFRRAAFSLIELLVVIGIIVTLAALVVPAVNHLGQANTLSAAGQSVIDALNLARQTALTRSRPVEVRLYKLPEMFQDSGTPVDYRGMQLFVIETTSAKALIKPLYFTNPMVISPSVATTSLLDDTNCPETAPGNNDAKLPGIGLNYKFRKFSFKTDGSTNLPLDGSWFVTLRAKTDPATRASGLPANFITVQIDPQSGRTKVFQP
jgi:uncharacterized protein (TIGR02596 family)